MLANQPQAIRQQRVPLRRLPRNRKRCNGWRALISRWRAMISGLLAKRVDLRRTKRKTSSLLQTPHNTHARPTAHTRSHKSHHRHSTTHVYGRASSFLLIVPHLRSTHSHTPFKYPSISRVLHGRQTRAMRRDSHRPSPPSPASSPRPQAARQSLQIPSSAPRLPARCRAYP